MNKILRYFILGGVFLTPFVVLFVSSSMFFPFITGKNFAFRIIVELMLGGWLILALRDSAYRLKFSWLFGTIAIFVGIIAFADMFGVYPFKSFWSNFERMEGFITLVHLLAYFVVLGAMLNTKKLWMGFFNTTVAVSIIIGIYGIFQLAGSVTIHQGGMRLDATLGNATYLAVYMLFHIFITAFLLIRYRGGSFVKWLYVSIIVLQTVILFFTATRGAILGLIGGVLLTALLIAIFEKERRVLRKSAIGALIAVIIFVGGFILIKDTDFVKSSPVLTRLASISLDSGQSRFMVWNMAWQGVKERPILGWGQENFNIVFNKYYDPKMYAQEPWFDRTHNIVFDWLIAGGVLGFIAYMSIFFAALYYLWKGRRVKFSVAEKSIFTGLFAAYFFNNLFVFDNITSYILFFSVLGYIHFATTKEEENSNGGYVEQNEEKKYFDIGTIDRIIVPIIVILIVFSIYIFNVKGILTSQSLIEALKPQKEGLEKNLEFFQKAIAYNVVGVQEAREQLVRAASNIIKGDVAPELKQKFFDVARAEMQKQIDSQPTDARTQIFMGSFLRGAGQYDDAFIYLNNARELSPNKQAVLFELGNSHLSQQKFEEALAVFKEAYELETNYGQARDVYALAAIYAGNDALAEELLIPVYGTVLIPNDMFIQAYFSVGQVNKVLAIWQMRVEQSPENSQFRISLAAAYMQVGSRAKAIQELEKAIELNPEFKEQGEFLISEIRAGRNP